MDERTIQPPTADDQMTAMLLEGNDRPRTAGLTYVNWQNDFAGLAGFLSESWLIGGPDAFLDACYDVAHEVASEALARKGFDEPTADEIRATVVETLFTPADNVATRTNFVRGALAEVSFAQQKIAAGFDVLTTDEAINALEGDDRFDDVWTAAKVEKNGFDVIVSDGENLETFQVKATVSKPSKSAKKNADELVWFQHKNGELQEARLL